MIRVIQFEVCIMQVFRNVYWPTTAHYQKIIHMRHFNHVLHRLKKIHTINRVLVSYFTACSKPEMQAYILCCILICTCYHVP